MLNYQRVDHVQSTLLHLYGRNDALADALALDRAATTPVEQRWVSRGNFFLPVPYQ